MESKANLAKAVINVMKVCSKCKSEKLLSDFFRDKDKKDGVRCECKICTSKRTKKYSVNNRDSIIKNKKKYYSKNKDAILLKMATEYASNLEESRLKKKNHYDKNKDNILKRNEQYRKLNRAKVLEKHKEWIRNQKITNPMFKVKANYRNRISKAIKTMGVHYSTNTNIILGISWEGLKGYMENKFVEGMTWDNYGLWHVDHIIPLYEAKDMEEFKVLNHYTNLQPLWAVDNLKKGKKNGNKQQK